MPDGSARAASQRPRSGDSAGSSMTLVPWGTLFSDDPEATGWHHPMATRYGVAGIPTVFLVNQQGNVVSLNARGAELGRLLARLIEGVEEDPEEDAAAEGGAEEGAAQERATIEGTPHDLRALTTAGAAADPCAFCHVPDDGGGPPSWNVPNVRKPTTITAKTARLATASQFQSLCW